MFFFTLKLPKLNGFKRVFRSKEQLHRKCKSTIGKIWYAHILSTVPSHFRVDKPLHLYIKCPKQAHGQTILRFEARKHGLEKRGKNTK